MFLPIPFLRRYQSCPRCNQQFERQHSQCPHCTHMTDAGVEVLKREQNDTLAANQALGRWLLWAALLLLIGTLAITL